MALKICTVLLVAYLVATVNSAAVKTSPSDKLPAPATAPAPAPATAPAPAAPANRGGKQIVKPLPTSSLSLVPGSQASLLDNILGLVCSILKGLLGCPCKGDDTTLPSNPLSRTLCTLLDQLVCPSCDEFGPSDLGIIESIVQLLKDLLGGLLTGEPGLEDSVKELILLLKKAIELLEKLLGSNQSFSQLGLSYPSIC